ncbi:MAG: CRISPR system precrRNA processing endoribonuclease RAMP protein Cas6 [Ardenticatenaceae bacterium]|nr:CRISPR system precrRNA processing endoribonuclease RAMP protein Cas6 [Ardenticatenaceae bacterium]
MLTMHHFEFEVEATTALGLYRHSGTALRAALFAALSRHFCTAPTAAAAGDLRHKEQCPVCWLLAREVVEDERGKDVPRPLALRPPPLGAPTDLRPGERWRFGLTLAGEQTVNLFPYLLLAVQAMGEQGVGRPVAGGRRGRFALRRVWAINPFTEMRQVLLAEGEQVVAMPDLPVTAAQVEAAAERLVTQVAARGGQLTLRFLTPMRLIERGALVHTARFAPLFQRVLERIEQLGRLYGSHVALAEEERARLLAAAGRVLMLEERTHWADVKSPSGRKPQPTPIGGFVGEATYRSDQWRSLLPWLLWGQLAQAGKNTTKGNGWYRVEGW